MNSKSNLFIYGINQDIQIPLVSSFSIEDRYPLSLTLEDKNSKSLSKISEKIIINKSGNYKLTFNGTVDIIYKKSFTLNQYNINKALKHRPLTLTWLVDINNKSQRTHHTTLPMYSMLSGEGLYKTLDIEMCLFLQFNDVISIHIFVHNCFELLESATIKSSPTPTVTLDGKYTQYKSNLVIELITNHVNHPTSTTNICDKINYL